MGQLYSKKDKTRQVNEAKSSLLPPEPYRSDFRRDKARLLHSPSFRRLRGKMQLFPDGEGDYYRNRLTHSLEVAQVATSIAIRLNHEKALPEELDCDLIELAAMAHDLGHPPFGHEGESELDQCMIDCGGFEGNAQTLRLLTRIEKKITTDRSALPSLKGNKDNRAGLNLTFRSLASILKYDDEIPMKRKQGADIAKGYYITEANIVANLKKNITGYEHLKGQTFKTVECQIMDIADDIAYSTYDLDDALKSGLVHIFDIVSLYDYEIEPICEKVNKSIKRAGVYGKKQTTPNEIYQKLNDIFAQLKLFGPIVEQEAFDHTNSSMVAWQIGAIYRTAKNVGSNAYYRNTLTSKLLGEFIREVKVDLNKKAPVFSKVYLNYETFLKVEVLKHLAFQFLINTSRWKIVARRSRQIVRTIFKTLSDDGGNDLLPPDVKAIYNSTHDETLRLRVICDFIASMTDAYAVEFYGRLQSDSPQSMFKPI